MRIKSHKLIENKVTKLIENKRTKLVETILYRLAETRFPPGESEKVLRAVVREEAAAVVEPGERTSLTSTSIENQCSNQLPLLNSI